MLLWASTVPSQLCPKVWISFLLSAVIMVSARATPTTTLTRREIASRARMGSGVVFRPTVVLDELWRNFDYKEDELH